MATKITTRVLADDAVTDAKIADVTLTTATQSASDNTTKIATTAYVTTAIANLADSAPSTLNTLNELAAALGDDANYATTTTNAIAAKLPLAGGTLTGALTTNGVINTGTSHNFAINTPNALRINIDSNNSGTSEVFVVGHNQTAVDASNDVLFRVGEDGKTGIGVGSPNATLQIGSTNAMGSSANPAIQVGGSSTYRLGLYTDAEGGIIQNLNGDDGLQFRVKTVGEAMRIDGGTGNVLIGTTTSPFPNGTGLGVASSTAISRLILQNSATGTGTSNGFRLAAVNTNVEYENVENGYQAFYNNGAIRSIIHANGKAAWSANGIGSTATVPRDFAFYTEGSTNGVEVRSNDQRLLFFGAGGSGGTGVDDGYLAMSSQGTGKIAFNANGDSYINGGNVGIGTSSPQDDLDIVGSGYQQIRISSNNSDNTNKTAGIISTTYTNQSVSVFQMFNQNGSNAIYYGSADGAHRGINQHYFYTNSDYNSTSGHKLRYLINGTGKHTFYGKHQGDSVGHFLFTNQVSGEDATNTNCTLAVQNGGTFIQIMGWTTLGARIGTRTGGWNSNSGGDVHFTRNDSMQIKLGSSGPVLSNGTAISSDERLKKNITDIADGQLAKINALRVRTFEWKNTHAQYAGTQEGFIAQEVESVMPEAVKEEIMAPDPHDDTRDFEGDVKLLKHEVINARLVKAVQELSAKLDAAEARIATLEG